MELRRRYVTGVGKKPRSDEELALFMDQTGRLRGWKGDPPVPCILLSQLWLRTLPLNQPLAGRCSMFASIETSILSDLSESRGCEIPALDKVHKAPATANRFNEKRNIDFGQLQPAVRDIYAVVRIVIRATLTLFLSTCTLRFECEQQQRDNCRDATRTLERTVFRKQ